VGEQTESKGILWMDGQAGRKREKEIKREREREKAHNIMRPSVADRAASNGQAATAAAATDCRKLKQNEKTFL
jgi:hypothetical protein